MCYTVASDAALPADIKDNYGNAPVDLARQRGNNEVADYITKYKPLARGELHMITEKIPTDLDIS